MPAHACQQPSSVTLLTDLRGRRGWRCFRGKGCEPTSPTEGCCCGSQEPRRCSQQQQLARGHGTRRWQTGPEKSAGGRRRVAAGDRRQRATDRWLRQSGGRGTRGAGSSGSRGGGAGEEEEDGVRAVVRQVTRSLGSDPHINTSHPDCQAVSVGHQVPRRWSRAVTHTLALLPRVAAEVTERPSRGWHVARRRWQSNAGCRLPLLPPPPPPASRRRLSTSAWLPLLPASESSRHRDPRLPSP